MDFAKPKILEENFRSNIWHSKIQRSSILKFCIGSGPGPENFASLHHTPGPNPTKKISLELRFILLRQTFYKDISGKKNFGVSSIILG